MRVDWTQAASSGQRPSMQDFLLKARFIKDALSYESVFGHYNMEWRSNADHQLRCPFHGADRNPSCHYYASDKRIWCFACSEGGDVTWFVMKKEGLRNNGEAVEFIARTFGITISDQDLNKRIALVNKVQAEEGDKRALQAKVHSEKVNDWLYAVRKQSKVHADAVDRLETLIFDRLYELRNEQVDYMSYVGMLRGWQQDAEGLIKQLLNGLDSSK